jgi:hypothetical protein
LQHDPEFGSFEAILLADKEELMDVDGWGCNRYKNPREV